MRKDWPVTLGIVRSNLKNRVAEGPSPERSRSTRPRPPQARLTLDLWAGTYWLNSTLDDYEELKDAVLLKGGKPITVPSSQWGTSYVLDSTHPTVKEHIRRVFRTYRDWGVPTT